MLGEPGEYAELPYFFTDQYDLGMEYAGHAPSYQRVVFRGDVDSREFVAFWLDGDKQVLAGMNVNVWDVLDDIKSLIRQEGPVDVVKLADPQVSLGECSADRDDVRQSLPLKPFPLGAPTFDPQPRIGGQRHRFVAGQVEDLAGHVDQLRVDKPRTQLAQRHSKLMRETNGGVVGQFPRGTGAGCQPFGQLRL